MNCEEARGLMAGKFDQSLSIAESSSLELHLEECAECRREAASLSELWGGLGQVSFPVASASVRARFYKMLGEQRREDWRARWSFGWVGQFAAAAALLALGVGIGYVSRDSRKEVSDLRSEVNTMRQMVALSLLRQQSASDRLRGVSYANQFTAPDPQVISALVSTVRQDDNVNVRLAAVDALHVFSSSPSVRDAAIGSLEMQEPLVQLALIDLLVDLKARAAAVELKKLVTERAIDNDVKERAQWALERLQ